jgi:hypothetical protein
MLLGDDQAGLVHHRAIGRDLARQPRERIGLGLDLDPAHMPVDDGDIDAAGTMVEPEFVDDKGVRAAAGMRQQAGIGRSSHIPIVEHHPHDGILSARDSPGASRFVRRRSA